jgi:hypothetical protein
MYADKDPFAEPPVGVDASALPDDLAAFNDAFSSAPLPELDLSTGTLGTGAVYTPVVNTSAPLPLASDATNLTYVEVPDVTGAVGLDGQIINATSRNDAESAAICGANSLQSSNYAAVCSILVTWTRGNTVYTKKCSGWIVGSRYIATAGHCVYDNSLGGFPDKNTGAVRIYCNGNVGCRGQVTTTYSRIRIASKWDGSSVEANPWDVAIIKTQDTLPYQALSWGERIGYQTDVLVSGYPGQETSIPNSPCQRYPGYTGCNQFVSFGSMSGKITDGFFEPNIDGCKGNSGSLMYDRVVNWVTGIYTGASYNPCSNFVVPLRVGGVDRGCNHPRGGVDLNCLIAATP